MTLTTSVVGLLRTSITGTVLTPDDDGYDDARRVWNADFDRRPAAVAQCLDARDVAAALTFAQDRGLEVAVRGGAHSGSGASSIEGGLVIDLSRMDQVTVDPQTRRARVGGGALLGQLDAAAQQHGLATPAGTVSHTGVGGLTLGGGMGWLSRKFGLSIDNLLSAEVVLADGRILRCSAEQEPDLFWALRGAGANFGVVTEFEFQLHPVDTMVSFSLLFWGLDQGPEMLRRIRDCFDAGLSRDVNIGALAMSAPPAPFVPEELHFAPGYAAVIVGFGDEEAFQATVAELQRDMPPLFAVQTPMPYVALQQFIDEPNAWGVYAYERGALLPALTDDAIDALTEAFPGKTSPLSVTIILRLDGAYCDVAEDDTAFGGSRAPMYQAFVLDIGPTKQLQEADMPWLRRVHAALEAHSTGGVYVNGTGDYGENRVRAIYGPKYERLAKLKAVYDPNNVFHRTANIRPALPEAWQPR